MSPIEILLEAKKEVPSLRYAIAVAGLGAAVAIILGFGLEPKIAVFGILIVVIFMFLVVLFANFAKHGGKSVIFLANFLAWSFTLITVISATALMCSFFFSKPKPIEELLLIKDKPEVIHAVVDLPRLIEDKLQVTTKDKENIFDSKTSITTSDDGDEDIEGCVIISVASLGWHGGDKHRFCLSKNWLGGETSGYCWKVKGGPTTEATAAQACPRLQRYYNTKNCDHLTDDDAKKLHTCAHKT